MSDKPHNQHVQSRIKPIEIKGGAVPPKPPVSPLMERKTISPDKGGKDNKK